MQIGGGVRFNVLFALGVLFVILISSSKSTSISDCVFDGVTIKTMLNKSAISMSMPLFESMSSTSKPVISKFEKFSTSLVISSFLRTLIPVSVIFSLNDLHISYVFSHIAPSVNSSLAMSADDAMTYDGLDD